MKHGEALMRSVSEPYLTDERIDQIRRQLEHCAFECLQRRRETNQRETEIEELEEMYKQPARYSSPKTNSNQPYTQWKVSGKE